MEREILSKTAEVLTDHDLCDFCLGRLFGKLSHGLSNQERGQALKTFLALAEDRPIEEQKIDAGYCAICQGLFEKLEEMAEVGLNSIGGYEFDSFLIGNRVPDELEEAQREIAKGFQITTAERISRDFNREVGKLFYSQLNKENAEAQPEQNKPDITIVLDPSKKSAEVRVKPVFIYGRYRKEVRGVPQSVWHCPVCGGKGCQTCDGTGKKYGSSIEELVSEPAMQKCSGADTAFHGCGREDVDARMKGEGRPFVVEIRTPRRRSVDLEDLQRTINEEAEGKISVSPLKMVNKSAVTAVKQGRPDKRYRVVVDLARQVSPEKIKSTLSELRGEVQQRTPARVSHRRTDQNRIRRVKQIRGKKLGDTRYEITLRTSSGLYVKELMHSDNGRTKPSLAELLGIEITVRELDVLEILAKLREQESGEYQLVPT
ncbi:MAG: tRNA pseudouridine(54/55) synthase Pus10 [Candidatus Acetothermia bacterium]